MPARSGRGSQPRWLKTVIEGREDPGELRGLTSVAAGSVLAPMDAVRALGLGAVNQSSHKELSPPQAVEHQ